MAKTLEQGFQDFLKRLVPLSSERDKGVSHKNSVKSCLKKSFNCSEFFETGSFGNKTGVKRFSDTDYFAVCSGQDLRTDSSTTLREVKEALQDTFHKTSLKIKVNSPSVTIPFGTHASENLEITPCFYNGLIKTPVGRKKSYGIPNGNKGWMLSSPRAHKAYVTYHNERLHRKLKPLITLIKTWKFYNNVSISSFYLELRITKLLEEKKKIDYSVDVYGTLKKLRDIGLADIQDPMGVSGNVSACKTEKKKKSALSKLKIACSRAEKAYISKNKNLDRCFYWWKMVYKGKFPSR
jgi:hypothetical protein